MRVTHDVYQIFEIPFGNVREPLVPASENQDVEPLDEQADERDDAVNPGDDTDQDPVNDTDEQFNTACVMLVREELFCVSAFGHTITISAYAGVRNKVHVHKVRTHFKQLSTLIFNNTSTDVIEHQTLRGLVV